MAWEILYEKLRVPASAPSVIVPTHVTANKLEACDISLEADAGLNPATLRQETPDNGSREGGRRAFLQSAHGLA